MNNREKSYLRAVEEAMKEFIQRDPYIMAKASATLYDEEGGYLNIPLLQKEYHIFYPSGKVVEKDGKDVGLPYQILLFHYLLMSRGLPLRNRLISFKEIPGGAVYYDAFYRRAIQPLIKTFGHDQKAFLKAGERLGGQREKLGDASLLFFILPKIPITYVLWEEDEADPPRASILFDESVKSYLPMEDMALLASIVVWGLMKAKL